MKWRIKLYICKCCACSECDTVCLAKHKNRVQGCFEYRQLWDHIVAVFLWVIMLYRFDGSLNFYLPHRLLCLTDGFSLLVSQ